MDAERFDSLARRLITASPRRRAPRGLVSAHWCPPPPRSTSAQAVAADVLLSGGVAS
jgi:hypothetical protein